MPQVSLTNLFGLDANGKLVDGLKFNQLLPGLVHLKDEPLDQVPFEAARADLTFSPLNVPAGDVTLQAGVRGGGSLALLGPARRAIDEDDPFSQIKIAPDEFYVALGVDFGVQADPAVAAGPVTFGFSADRGITIRTYHRFVRGPQGLPPFVKALGETASSFLLPRKFADLDALQTDTVVVIAGHGEMSVSGGVTVETPVQALASTAAVAGKAVDVSASGSISASLSVRLSGDYQVRLRRLGPRKVEVGVYRSKSREVDFAVTAEAGVAATVGKFDLAEQFIRALSRQPAVDVEEFRRALPGENADSRERQIEGFQDSLKAAISTKVQASMRVAFSRLDASDAAWLFEIDLDAADTATRAAIDAALSGDFTALTRDPQALPPGVVQTENILTHTELRKQSLQVNLLGILNYLSVTKITRFSSIEKNPSGEITLIADTSSASRLQALLLNAGVNAKRLRRMLSENFLIEATYHASNVGVLPPDFTSKHTHLDIHDPASRSDMKDDLDVARVLGLILRSEEDERLGARDGFGRTTFYAETGYAGAAVKSLFLDGSGQPRPVEEFETAGRSALGALLLGDTGQEFRQRFADVGMEGTELWNKMKKTGNTAAFGPLFGIPAGVTNPQVEAAGSDYIVITSWAAAMHEAGKAIQEVNALLGDGAVAFDDPRLTAARELLKRRLADVVGHSQDHFGDPLGLIMVYVASGQTADRRVIVTGDEIEPLDTAKSSPLAAGAGKAL